MAAPAVAGLHGVGYAPSIVTAGLTDVWALSYTAGLGSAVLTKVAGVDALPAGVTITQDPNGPGGAAPFNTLRFTGNVDLANWDLTGYNIAINASVVVTFTNCKLMYSTAPSSGPFRTQYWIALGNIGGAPTVSFTNCTLDFQSYSNGNTINQTGGTLSFSNCRFVNGSQDYVITATGLGCNVDRCYFSSFGINSIPIDHLETIHYFSGTNTFTNSFIDCRDGIGRVAGGLTAILFPASTSAMSLAIDRCILLGVGGIGALFTLQAKTAGGNINLTITNSVLEKGLSSYLATTLGTGTITLTESGNRDYATGNPITP